VKRGRRSFRDQTLAGASKIWPGQTRREWDKRSGFSIIECISSITTGEQVNGWKGAGGSVGFFLFGEVLMKYTGHHL